MDIFVKALLGALLATIAIIGIGKAGLKTNDLRNYPNLKPSDAPASGTPGAAPGPAAPSTNASTPKADAKVTNGGMTQGEEAAAQSGFSTELENPNK